MKSNINLLVVGGCFPVQTNIPTENLYHFLLKEKIRNELSVKIEINILQYEKISPTFKRIKEVIEHKNIDLIIFHIRIEQILRMIKFYLRYHNKNEIYHRGLNLAALGNCIPERKEFNLHHTIENRGPNTIKFSNNFLKNINYILGYLVFNPVFAFKIYKGLITSVVEFCNNNFIDMIITGPVSRPVNSIENFTSVILDFYMNKLILNKYKKKYLKLLGTNHNSKYQFCDDQIRVNEIGHQRIANILFSAVKNILKL